MWFPSFPLACHVMTQDSRQALIELLFLSLYLDDHLSLAEDNVLNEALESLGWESPQPRDHFIFAAFAAAREASANLEKTQKFVIARADLLTRDGEEASGITWLNKVLGADGFSPSEKYFLGKLEARLFPVA